ncbi:uncharacterized protein U069_c3941 [Escherichia coli K-12]|nr:uncharacterized protein U069_c3941 [Escherichia coli K-12]
MSPESFATAPENISGTVASVITPAGMFRISQESWLCTPNAAGPQRTVCLTDEYHPELTIKRL